MSKRDLKFLKLSDTEKQKTPHPDEVDPDASFIKASIAASRAAQKYRLKGLKIDDQDSRPGDKS